jgi:hypothetical protein
VVLELGCGRADTNTKGETMSAKDPCKGCGAIPGKHEGGCDICTPRTSAEAEAGELIATRLTKKGDFGLAEAAIKSIQTDH